MEASESEHGAIPPDLKDRLTAFDDSLTRLEASLEPLLSVPRNELSEKLCALDQAKIDLLSAYALNSMFWMYLNTCGENPKDHGIKQELDRIRTYMGRVKEIQDKVNAPKLDKNASKRFVKSALWQAAQNTVKESKEDTPVVKEEELKPDLKRKSETNHNPVKRSHREKKKKKKEKNNV
ncbi:nuclear nucleic acid-binding protein C1D-like [Liolophura sinensis]|uniref:nuclear nucleic acid-binding protein C1D-like n=1 Tax=Liolophura sinensis TaxID=3198878 RepID=UPI003158E9D1